MATHSNILSWEIQWTGEPGGPEFIGSQLDMTEHTHTQLVTVRCKSVDEILSQMFHHSDSLSDKFRAETFLVLILLLTLCVWLIKFIQSLWGLIYFSVKSKALDVVSRFKYFYPMEYFLKSYWRVQWAPQVALVVNIPPANTGDIRDLGSIPESGRSAGEGNGYPCQYSCLEYPMDRGAWSPRVHGITKSWTPLNI